MGVTMYTFELKPVNLDDYELWINGKHLIGGNLQYCIGYGDAYADMLGFPEDEVDAWREVANEALRADYLPA